MDRTHDISLIDFHLKDLATFGHCLTEAANAAFPKGPARYKEVHALLLSWEADTLGAIEEVLELRDVFRQDYCYDAEEWRIPSVHSFRALRQRIGKFLDDFEGVESLLIVYYGGRMYPFPCYIFFLSPWLFPLVGQPPQRSAPLSGASAHIWYFVSRMA